MFRITHGLSVGPFPDADDVPDLLAAKVTHVLNVCDSPPQVSTADGFAGVEWVPMLDSVRLPRAVALKALDTLHGFASEPGSHVYVHCVAGQLRSPTVLWLYLLALGAPPADAREWVEGRAPDAVAGHFRMVDQEHVALVQEHGRTHYLPLARPDLIVPFPGNEVE
jgi:hypothetical protein